MEQVYPLSNEVFEKPQRYRQTMSYHAWMKASQSLFSSTV